MLRSNLLGEVSWHFSTHVGSSVEEKYFLFNKFSQGVYKIKEENVQPSKMQNQSKAVFSFDLR